MIITLCGSTKFKDEFLRLNLQLSKAGHVVFSVAGFGHQGDELSANEKERLDKVHLMKIDLSDAIFVIQPGGYIGESTRQEILYAHSKGKKVLTAYGAGIGIIENGEVLFYQPFRNACHYASCFDPTAGIGPCALCYE